MPVCTLTFSLPEDELEFKYATHASKVQGQLSDFDEYLRTIERRQCLPSIFVHIARRENLTTSRGRHITEKTKPSALDGYTMALLVRYCLSEMLDDAYNGY